MRLLLVTGSFPPMPCGVGDYTHALAQALSENGAAEVGVLTSTGANAAPAGRYEVFPVVRNWRSSDVAQVREVLRRWRPDLIHFQFPTQGYQGNLAWQLPLLLGIARRPVVQTWHETVPGRWGGWMAGTRPTLAEKLRTAIPQVVLSLAPGELVVVRPEFEARMPRWYRLLGIRRRLRLIPNASAIPRIALSDGERLAVRERYGAPGKALLAFFGFFYEQKGIDDLLEIFDGTRQHLVMVGDANQADPYQRNLLRRLREPPLARNVTLSGFLPPLEAARVLAAADAVVLPYRDGSGEFNTTLKAALLQGTFVLTTSAVRHGFDSERNAYFARPGDFADMTRALGQYLGRRNDHPPPDAGPTWAEIAERHLELYRLCMRRALPGSLR